MVVFPGIETPETVVPSGNLNSPGNSLLAVGTGFSRKCRNLPVDWELLQLCNVDEMPMMLFFAFSFLPLKHTTCLMNVFLSCYRLSVAAEAIVTKISSTTEYIYIKFVQKFTLYIPLIVSETLLHLIFKRENALFFFNYPIPEKYYSTAFIFTI